jgi:hypothetical protein
MPVSPKPNALERTIELDRGATALVEGGLKGSGFSGVSGLRKEVECVVGWPDGAGRRDGGGRQPDGHGWW